MDLLVADPEIDVSTRSGEAADYYGNMWNPNMVHVGVSACGFGTGAVNSMLGAKRGKMGATVIDYSDRNYKLN